MCAPSGCSFPPLKANSSMHSIRADGAAASMGPEGARVSPARVCAACAPAGLLQLAVHAAISREVVLPQLRHNVAESSLHTLHAHAMQGALEGTEDRVRASEALERSRMAADYEARVASLMGELERLREELQYRTSMMAAEMERCAWGCAQGAAVGGGGVRGTGRSFGYISSRRCMQ